MVYFPGDDLPPDVGNVPVTIQIDHLLDLVARARASAGAEDDEPEPDSTMSEQLEPVLPAPTVETDERAHLGMYDMISARPATPNLGAGERLLGFDRYMRFFTHPQPDDLKEFGFFPLWRTGEIDPLDELTLIIDANALHKVIFNGKPAHGNWIFDDPASASGYLDVKFNRFFDACDPDEGNWIRFQRMPGTTTWVDILFGCILVPVYGY